MEGPSSQNQEQGNFDPSFIPLFVMAFNRAQKDRKTPEGVAKRFGYELRKMNVSPEDRTKFADQAREWVGPKIKALEAEAEPFKEFLFEGADEPSLRGKRSPSQGLGGTKMPDNLRRYGKIE